MKLPILVIGILLVGFATAGCEKKAEVAGPTATPPPVAASAPAPAPASAARPGAAAVKLEKVTLAEEAYFEPASTQLKSDMKTKLDGVLQETAVGMTVDVVVMVGHADNTEGKSAADRRTLSVSRAEAIKAYFVSKGVESAKIYAEGKGDTQPVADNRQPEGRAKNRRVEIEIVGSKPQR